MTYRDVKLKMPISKINLLQIFIRTSKKKVFESTYYNIIRT